MTYRLTGAGVRVTDALLQGRSPPEHFTAAMDEICRKARSQNCRLWIDAEQQVVQTAIDRWTIDLMRRYNKDGKAIVYNTLQAYLKKSRNKLMDQLAAAKKEDWTLAIKLVRGAYMANDQREKIHDTKTDTDNSYDGIVEDLLTGTNLGFTEQEFPHVELFLAGHNPVSIAKASNLVGRLTEQGRLKVVPDFGQLQGMADEVGCNLLQYCEDLQKSASAGRLQAKPIVVPSVYKCLTWGTIQECMQYLIRRVVENSGGTDRMKDGMTAYYGELRRRILAGMSLRTSNKV
jgi:proline dehydrogenase